MTDHPKRLIVHSEKFHTDDVFATALLLAIYPDATVTRSRDPEVIQSGDIVYDVGKNYDPAAGRFDHHQEGAPRRDNGIIYSSFGLLWKEYGAAYCDGDAAVARAIESKLVVPVDANDNGQAIFEPTYSGVEPFTVDTLVSIMNPLLWTDESETYDTQFLQAVSLASQILARVRLSAENTLISQRAVVQAYADNDDKRFVVMDKQAAFSDILEECPELLYVVSPRLEGSWGVVAIPDKKGSYTPRRAFPEPWRAKQAAELVSITGVKDVIFCHATGFLCVAESKQGALALIRKSLAA